MLIKGSARGKPGGLAKHLKKEENESVRVVRSQGVLAQDIDAALLEMDALGADLRTRRTLYHMSLNPQPGTDRAMDGDDWNYAENTALKKLGLENQPYIVIEHEKFGKDGALRLHHHIVVARADLEHECAIRCDHNYRKHEEAAREIERYLGHEKVQGAHADRSGVERPDRTPTAAEQREAERGGVPAKQAKAFVTELFQRADSGPAFHAALDEQDWILARGDKTTADGKPYLMVIDPQGGTHELRRCVQGVKAAELYARMEGVDRERLPTVRAAKDEQLERGLARVEQNLQQGIARETRPLNRTAGETHLAYSLSDSAAGFVEALEERGLRLARVSEQEPGRERERER